MRPLVLILSIMLSCICFFFGGMFLGFYNGKHETYNKINEEQAKKQRIYSQKNTDKSKSILGAPIKSRRSLSRKYIGGSREVSPAALKRIEQKENE